MVQFPTGNRILIILMRTTLEEIKIISKHEFNRFLLAMLLTVVNILKGVSISIAQQSLRNGKIAFASNRDGNYEIYVMDADGTNLIQLTDNQYNDTQPSWSPDGTQIVFCLIEIAVP